MTGARHNPHSEHIPGPVKPMKYMIDRLMFQVLLQTGYTQKEVSEYANLGQRSDRKIEHEPQILTPLDKLLFLADGMYRALQVPQPPQCQLDATGPNPVAQGMDSGVFGTIKRPGPGF